MFFFIIQTLHESQLHCSFSDVFSCATSMFELAMKQQESFLPYFHLKDPLERLGERQGKSVGLFHILVCSFKQGSLCLAVRQEPVKKYKHSTSV